jgi:hypothetical protein
MMPKNKATELTEKFGKETAFKVLEEILDAIKEYQYSSLSHEQIFDYWLDVKNELKKL